MEILVLEDVTLIHRIKCNAFLTQLLKFALCKSSYKVNKTQQQHRCFHLYLQVATILEMFNFLLITANSIVLVTDLRSEYDCKLSDIKPTRVSTASFESPICFKVVAISLYIDLWSLADLPDFQSKNSSFCFKTF